MLQLDYQEGDFYTGRLCLNSARWLRQFAARPVVVSIFPAFAKDRQAVTDFIAGIFAKAYDAQIGVHYPILMSVSDCDGKILAALGFRYASAEPLFLEQYLQRPVEDILKAPRAAITEIGNLASGGGGASMFLFAALSAYLHERGQVYAVVTGTDFLEHRLHTLGLRPQRLASADPGLLLHGDENWGRYYETDPHVLAGRIDSGYRRLQKVLGARYTEEPRRYVPRLHYRENPV